MYSFTTCIDKWKLIDLYSLCKILACADTCRCSRHTEIISKCCCLVAPQLHSVSQETCHDGGCSCGILSSSPAFPNVWTPGLLTHLRKKTDTGVFKCTRIDTRLLDLTYQVFYTHVEIFWYNIGLKFSNLEIYWCVKIYTNSCEWGYYRLGREKVISQSNSFDFFLG